MAVGSVGLLACSPQAASNISQLLTFLMTLQSAALLSFDGGNESALDPKTYVDLPFRETVNATGAAFRRLPRDGGNGGGINNATLHDFLADYFDPAGSELVVFQPPDFAPAPAGFLDDVRNSEVHSWALQVHAIWRNLSRRERPEVVADPDRFTMVPLQHPFVVPGARFREVYYWDSYWVIRGLLVSKMQRTARGMVENLLALVESYGFVANGARTYYLNRSQPPLLSQMVKAVFEATGDSTLLERAVPALVREHGFWTTAPHAVQVRDARGRLHSLSRYFAKWDTPRPESSTIDEAVAAGVSAARRPQLYNDIATGAETGWDFSSRWMADRFNLTTLRTTRIVPADLNAYLFQMETNIAAFAKVLGDADTRKAFAAKARARRAAIQTVLWNEDMKQWNDYWLPADFCDEDGPVDFDPQAVNQNVYASNFLPLWCGLIPHTSAGLAVVEALVGELKSSGLVQPAGIATSLIHTGQQWDYPNGWAPLQHMLIEGLYATHSRSAKTLAEDLAERWLQTNFATFARTGAMVEKYDVSECDLMGSGGEYAVQTGFGWSNGVVLSLLDMFGWPEHRPIACPSAPAPAPSHYTVHTSLV